MRVKEDNKSMAQRVLGAVDLAIDFATLGEYGLEPITADPDHAAAQPPRRTRKRRRALQPTVSGARARGCGASAPRSRRRSRARRAA